MNFYPLLLDLKKYFNLCKSFTHKTLKYFKWKKTTSKKKRDIDLLGEQQHIKNAEYYNNKGVYFINKKRYDKAQQCFEKALLLDPNHTYAHSNIGQLFQEKKCFKEAQQHFEKVLSLDPEQVNSRWNLSLIQLTLGNFSQGWENHEARYHKRPLHKYE
ncbi:FOG: TPR repeat [Bathymodiolus heckerae thiotrophic gill symbiont]|nr:FOG: TPR repeat [Bathymodiolus heckerae thiotrophic gill symbiont]